MKVYFFLLGHGNSTTSYSNLMFAEGIKARGYDVSIIFDLEEKSRILQEANEGDVIFFQKTIQCALHTSSAIQHLKGKVFLIHIDDDFQDMRSDEHIRTLELTDLILVGTNRHKYALKDYTSVPVETISCVLDDENYHFIPPHTKHNNPLIIGWQQSCADAYTKDLLSIAEPLKLLHEKYGFILNLYGWHLGKDYRDLSAPVREALPFANFIEYQPLELYLKNILPSLSQSDLFIAPYIDIPDRWGKSGFSLKRIMLLGIPVVASHTEHNATLISHGQTGFLADTPTEWYTSLEKLLIDHSLRSKFAYAARDYMDQYYNQPAIIDRLISNIQKHCPYF